MLGCFSWVQLFVTLWTVSHQAPLSMGFSRQRYWNGFAYPPPGDLPDPGIEPAPLMSPTLSLWLHHLGSPINMYSVEFSHPVVFDSLWPHWTAARQASLTITNSWSLPKLMSIVLVMPSNHLILCHPLLLLHSIFASIRVFSNESALCIRWPKYWSFSFNIRPSNEHPGLISFRMDWLDLLAVQGTLKSLLQHHSSKASILLHSAFFIVQLSHPYMTTGKTIALTRWNFVDKVMSLLLNMLSRLVITFLPRSKHLFISWLQSPSAVILEPRKIKSATVSTVGLIAQLGCNPMDYSPLGSSVHGILQGRILEWINCFLLQGLFLTQGSNPGFMHCRQILYSLSHQVSSSTTRKKKRRRRRKSYYL